MSGGSSEEAQLIGRFAVHHDAVPDLEVHQRPQTLRVVLASRVPRQEEYIARVPAIAILPWFLAGALFPITATPIGLTWVARFLPLTHALALMRYGLLGDGSGLHNIWRMSSAPEMAALSTGVVGLFAVVLTVVAVRVFTRAALR